MAGCGILRILSKSRPCVTSLVEIYMTTNILLKKDLFGEVRRISCDEGDTIVRDAGAGHPLLGWLARYLMRREARILAHLDELPGTPTVIRVSHDKLTRQYIDGAPMQEAKPRSPAYFRQAARLLRALHRIGVAHNDLAKEPNLLVSSGGQAALVDFQLAVVSARRGRLFRTLAYDDIRHLLKHKRTYCPDSLSRRERRILANPSLPSKIWMRTGKPIYLFVTRRILGWADREGAADRGRPD